MSTETALVLRSPGLPSGSVQLSRMKVPTSVPGSQNADSGVWRRCFRPCGDSSFERLEEVTGKVIIASRIKNRIVYTRSRIKRY